MIKIRVDCREKQGIDLDCCKVISAKGRGCWWVRMWVQRTSSCVRLEAGIPGAGDHEVRLFGATGDGWVRRGMHDLFVC